MCCVPPFQWFVNEPTWILLGGPQRNPHNRAVEEVYNSKNSSESSLNEKFSPNDKEHAADKRLHIAVYTLYIMRAIIFQWRGVGPTGIIFEAV